MKTKITTFFLLLLALLVSACSGSNILAQADLGDALAALGPKAWIDAPLNGQSLLMANAPFDVVVHGNDPSGLTGFALSVNGLPYATSATQNQGETFTDFTFEWTPQAPGTYLLSVRAMAGDSLGTAAEVQVTINGDVADGSDEIAPLQPTRPATSEDSVSCTYRAFVNLFCRTGPGQVYPELDSFTPDTVADVIGISPDGTHVQVLGPTFGNACFVPVEQRFGELAGACDDLATVPIPATPTHTPTVTPEPEQPTATPPPTLPQCSDGIDNDGDGDIDMSDGRCTSPDDDNENG